MNNVDRRLAERMGSMDTATIESCTPGRMRVRVPKAVCQGATWAAALVALRSLAGVLRVVTNTLTGSTLVEFDPEIVEFAEIVAVLETANVVIDVGIHVGQAMLAAIEHGAGPRIAEVAHREHEQLHGLDMALHRATGGAASLRPILPFMIAALIVVSLRHGWLSGEGLREALEHVRG